MTNKSCLQVFSLDPWKLKIQELLSYFLHLDSQHIYREYNEEVNLLSKQALFLEEGKVYLNVFRGEELVSTYY